MGGRTDKHNLGNSKYHLSHAVFHKRYYRPTAARPFSCVGIIAMRLSMSSGKMLKRRCEWCMGGTTCNLSEAALFDLCTSAIRPGPSMHVNENLVKSNTGVAVLQ